MHAAYRVLVMHRAKMSVPLASDVLLSPRLHVELKHQMSMNHGAARPVLQLMDEYLTAAQDLFNVWKSTKPITEAELDRAQRGCDWFVQWWEQNNSDCMAAFAETGDWKSIERFKTPKAVSIWTLLVTQACFRAVLKRLSALSQAHDRSYRLYPTNLSTDWLENLFCWARSGGSSQPHAGAYAARLGIAMAARGGTARKAKSNTGFVGMADLPMNYSRSMREEVTAEHEHQVTTVVLKKWGEL